MLLLTDGGGEMVFFQDILDEDALSQFFIGRLFIERVPEQARVDTYWKYRRSAEGLYDMLDSCKFCMIRAQTSSTWTFSFWPKSDIFDQTVIVFGTNCKGLWLVLNSSIHEVWVEKYSRLMKADTAYALTNCFNNFPLPYNPLLESKQHLALLAEQLDLLRRQMTLSLGIGNTELLMSINDATQRDSYAEQLRQSKYQMDSSVAAAYGWTDLRPRP